MRAMGVDERYLRDVETIMAQRHALGADYFTTPDRRLLKGSPFSALSCAHMLLELGMAPEDAVLRGVAGLFFEAWREDGRFKLYPGGAIHPCHTALAALQGKLVDGQVVVERVAPKLAKLEFCKKGQPSALATRRYAEILANLRQA